MSRKPIGQQNYEQFAERYAALVANKPHNAYCERPATLSLLPDVNGLRVLDAGCGPGHYAEWLLDKGAEVVAFDVTPDFLRIARERVGDRATVLCHDLNEPLDFAEDESFDGVLCALVLDYIKNWRAAFREFYRVLRPGGVLVCSFTHPIFYFRVFGDKDYFTTDLFEMEWTGFGPPHPVIKAYRRPIGEMLNPITEAGLRIDGILESKPVEALKEIDPQEYADMMQRPSFMHVRATK